MTTFQLTHLPSGETHTIEANSVPELAAGIARCPFKTTYPGAPVPVRVLFSTRTQLVLQISEDVETAEHGSWRLEKVPQETP